MTTYGELYDEFLDEVYPLNGFVHDLSDLFRWGDPTGYAMGFRDYLAGGEYHCPICGEFFCPNEPPDIEDLVLCHTCQGDEEKVRVG